MQYLYVLFFLLNVSTLNISHFQGTTSFFWCIQVLWQVIHICVCERVCACVCLGEWASACACVHVALLIQHASHMRHIVTSVVAPLAPSYISTYLINGTIFEKQLLNIKFLFLFSLKLLCKTCFHFKTNLARYCHRCENVVGVKCP